MNGLNYSLSGTKLKILFGRLLYLRHGRVGSIREFLKDYNHCDSHIDLIPAMSDLVKKIMYKINRNVQYNLEVN